MIHKIFPLKYEISEDGQEDGEKFDSLDEAVERMSERKFLIAKYDIQFDDRIAIQQKEILEFAEIAHLNQQEIVEEIEQRIKSRYN